MSFVFNTKKGEKIIIDKDMAYLAERSWQLNTVGYARRTMWRLNRKPGECKTRTVLLHRLIMNAPKGMVVDHINGNKLDNRRQNLRLCTQSENIANRRKPKDERYSSKYFGVSYSPHPSQKSCPWKTQVTVGGKRMRKSFKTELEAALFYNELIKNESFKPRNIIPI